MILRGLLILLVGAGRGGTVTLQRPDGGNEVLRYGGLGAAGFVGGVF